MNKEALNVLNIIKNQFKSDHSDINTLRRDLDEFYLSFRSQGPLNMVKEEDAPVPSYWLVTPHCSPQKVVLFFHGGGFNMGSTYGHQDLCQRLSKNTGCSIFSVDYRLAPEHPFPAAAEECLNSYLWLLEEGLQTKDIVIVGLSAGGNLALSTLLALKKDPIHLPRGVVCMSPVVDLTFPIVYQHLKDVRDWLNHERLYKLRELYLKGQDPNNPMASPIFGDLKGIPPLMLQVGSRELLLCDINRFRDLAVEKKVKVNFEVWQGMFHCWQIFSSRLPEADRAMESIGKFVRQLFD